MNLKEELAERHLLASEERSPSCCDWGGVALGDGDDDHDDNDDYNDGDDDDDDDDDYNSDDVDNVVSGNQAPASTRYSNRTRNFLCYSNPTRKFLEKDRVASSSYHSRF